MAEVFRNGEFVSQHTDKNTAIFIWRTLSYTQHSGVRAALVCNNNISSLRVLHLHAAIYVGLVSTFRTCIRVASRTLQQFHEFPIERKEERQQVCLCSVLYLICVRFQSKFAIHCARRERLFHAREFSLMCLGVNCKVKRVVRKYVLVSVVTIIYIFRYIKCRFVCDGLSYGSHNHRQPTHMQQRNVTITAHDGTNKK